MKFLMLFLFMFSFTGLAFAENDVRTLIVGNQIMITTDVTNSLNTQQPFVYITQVKNSDNTVVSLSWLTGSLSPRQSFSPAQSWTSTEIGMYTIEVFVWKSIDNPEALSSPLFMKVNVVDPKT
ncbi:hypothetical protein [Nitrosarchaeum sp. AC2]|uniref:hypothetical protein n=1 Tax=Nitrosarchaeum sp. AC2 TaxID=2259673 RepID=UPI0015C74BDA|nr:hypothetical protein [Nitrosarchaeum sp. AC2]